MQTKEFQEELERFVKMKKNALPIRKSWMKQPRCEDDEAV